MFDSVLNRAVVVLEVPLHYDDALVTRLGMAGCIKRDFGDLHGVAYVAADGIGDISANRYDHIAVRAEIPGQAVIGSHSTTAVDASAVVTNHIAHLQLSFAKPNRPIRARGVLWIRHKRFLTVAQVGCMPTGELERLWEISVFYKEADESGGPWLTDRLCGGLKRKPESLWVQIFFNDDGSIS